MLILTRHVDEAIIIGDDIRIVVMGSVGGKVRIGINAPKSIEVHREEVYELIRNNPAARTSTSRNQNHE